MESRFKQIALEATEKFLDRTVTDEDPYGLELFDVIYKTIQLAVEDKQQNLEMLQLPERL